MKSLFDPSFKYVKAVETDIRKTFARVRREMKQKSPEQVVRLPVKMKK